MNAFRVIVTVLGVVGAAVAEAASHEMFPPETAGKGMVLMAARGKPEEGGVLRRRHTPPVQRRGVPVVADQAVYPFFEDVAYTTTVTRVSQGYGGAVIVESKLPKSDAICISVYTPEGERHEVSFTEKGYAYVAAALLDGEFSMQEIDPSLDPREDAIIPAPEPQMPAPVLPGDGVEPWGLPLEAPAFPEPPEVEPPILAAGNVVLNLMIVIDQPAVTWANANAGGATTLANAATTKMNTVLANSGIACTMNLVDTYTPSYTAVKASGDDDLLNTALLDLSDGRGGLSGVPARRISVKADVATVLVGGSSIYAGLGWAPSSPSGFYARMGNSACVVNYASSNTTMTHEIGHNIGCGHSKTQTSGPGPQCGSYAAGWYFTANSTRYCTVMSYNARGDGYNYTTVPYFSTPLVNYQGVAVGHAADGDNARCFRENMATVAGYKLPLPTNVSGSSTYADRVQLTWTAASGVSQYRIYRSTESNYTTATLLTTVSGTQYNDTTAIPGLVWYYYWVKSYDGTSESSGVWTYGSRSLPAPTSVSATQGTLSDRVRITWAAGSGVTGYKVFRNTSNSSSSATQIGTINSGSTLQYDDTTAASGTGYWYWVKATTSAADSGFSAGVSGYRTFTTPTGLTASNAAYIDKIVLSWNAVSGAASYKLFRSTSNDSSSASQVGGTIIATTYNDTGATAGTTYYYWVKAVNGTVESGFSSVAFGVRALPLAVPINVEGSNATYPDKIRLTWTASSGATCYNIYRSLENNSSTATFFATTTDTYYDDTDTIPGLAWYYYWLKASNGVIESSGVWTYGRRAFPAPTVTAGQGTFTDKVRVSWTQCSGATSYKVYRNTSNSSSTSTEIATISNGSTLQYDDTTAAIGTIYYYWVKGFTSVTETSYSSSASGYRAFSAPTGLAASNGAHTDKIALSWNATAGAASYKLYRSTSNDSSAASQIGGTITTTSYDDTGATPGTTYYYWVKASVGTSTSDSAFSTMAQGMRMISPPTNVAANGNTDRVRITWTSASGAASYKVYRNTADNSGAATLLGSVTASPYDDTDATPGVTYYYWVKTVNGSLESAFSAPAQGTRTLSAPAGLTASNNTDVNQISLSWTASAGAVSYTIYRNTSSSSSTATQIGTAVSASYNDTTATPATLYYYWVKSVSGTFESAFSASASGRRSLSPPTTVTASNGDYTDKVTLTWAASDGAATYRVYRNTSDDATTATQIATSIATTSYDNTSATAGIVYYYWVIAVNGSYLSAYSASVQGYRALAAPATVSATQNNANYVRVSWSTVSGSTSYKLYRNTSNDSTGATLIATPSVTSYDDTSATPGTAYFYWVKASNGTFESAYSSTSAQGWRTLPAPTGLAVSNIIRTDAIALLWNATTGATSYNIYRSTASSSSGATLVGTSTSAAYDDTSAAPGTLYYYWIKAATAVTESAFSASARGIRSLCSFSEALNNTDLVWTTDGDAPWFTQGQDTSDGLHAARSGFIAHSQSSRLETIVTGPGILTFQWRVSSESSFDFLSFMTNGFLVARIAGTSVLGWTERSLYIPPGIHTNCWEYSKDNSTTSGEDCGWLDCVQWRTGTLITATVPSVPFAWLLDYYPNANSASFDSLAASKGLNNYFVWQSYVAGLIPTNAASRFVADIKVSNGKPAITWKPDLGTKRAYTLLGKPSLDATLWQPVADTNNIPTALRFFKVEVNLP